MPAAKPRAPRPDEAQRAKLSYKESRELAELPARIESLEAEQCALTDRMSRGDYHRQGAEQIRTDRQRLEEIERLLASSYERWGELDTRSAAAR